MIIIGASASLIPLDFLSLCAWVTFSLPKRLHEADIVFLNTFAFLLFRFHLGAQNYVLVVLLWNFALAVVPVIADPASELFSSAAVVLICVLLSASMSPWAVCQARHLDAAMHTGVLFVLLLAALQTDSVDDVVVGNLLLAVFSVMMCAFLGAMAWCLHLCALRLRKPFQFFLCHHKVGGGAFCRLMKVRLTSHGQVARGVFLDSDNLQELSLLFGIVSEKTETVGVLCTREVLHRPCCVGEMTTARLHSIDTILVIFPDFENPFIDNFASVEGVHSLAPFGVSLELAQQTLWWLGTRPWMVLPRSTSTSGVLAVVEKLVGRRKGKQEMSTVSCMNSMICSPETAENDETVVRHWRTKQTVSHVVSEPVGWSTPAAVDVVSIVDHTNQESVCTALLVSELLKRFFSLTQSAIGATPIIVDDSFQFPSDAFFQDIRALSTHILSRTGTGQGADDLIRLIKKLFEEIGIHVRPQDSQGVLEVGDVRLAQKFQEMTWDLAAKRSHCQSQWNPSNGQSQHKGIHVFPLLACAKLHAQQCSKSSKKTVDMWCAVGPRITAADVLLFFSSHSVLTSSCFLPSLVWMCRLVTPTCTNWSGQLFTTRGPRGNHCPALLCTSHGSDMPGRSSSTYAFEARGGCGHLRSRSG